MYKEETQPMRIRTRIGFFLLLLFNNAMAVDSALYIAPDRELLLSSAREIIASDPFMTLITVDEAGRARARTVEHSPPDEDMTIWISTIPSTRKLDQIQQNPKVTLYFDGPGDTSYVTIMGVASIHSDRDTAMSKTWRDPTARARFWPDFPKNYVLIRVKPSWIEVVADGIDSREKDWRPQAVLFEKPTVLD
jgi:general stress protein 26